MGWGREQVLYRDNRRQISLSHSVAATLLRPGRRRIVSSPPEESRLDVFHMKARTHKMLRHRSTDSRQDVPTSGCEMLKRRRDGKGAVLEPLKQAATIRMRSQLHPATKPVVVGGSTDVSCARACQPLCMESGSVSSCRRKRRGLLQVCATLTKSFGCSRRLYLSPHRLHVIR